MTDTCKNNVVEFPVGGGGERVTIASGLASPQGLTVDAAGDVFITDTGNNRVVEVLAGSGTQISVASSLGTPYAVAVDGSGNVYVADTGNNRVLELQRALPPTLTFADDGFGECERG